MTGFSKGVRVNYRINEVLQSYKAIPSYGIITQQEGQLPYKQEASGAKSLFCNDSGRTDARTDVGQPTGSIRPKYIDLR